MCFALTHRMPPSCPPLARLAVGKVGAVGHDELLVVVEGLLEEVPQLRGGQHQPQVDQPQAPEVRVAGRAPADDVEVVPLPSAPTTSLDPTDTCGQTVLLVGRATLRFDGPNIAVPPGQSLPGASGRPPGRCAPAWRRQAGVGSRGVGVGGRGGGSGGVWDPLLIRGPPSGTPFGTPFPDKPGRRPAPSSAAGCGACTADTCADEGGGEGGNPLMGRAKGSFGVEKMIGWCSRSQCLGQRWDCRSHLA